MLVVGGCKGGVQTESRGRQPTRTKGNLKLVPCDRNQNGSDLNVPATVTGFFTVC